MQRLWFLLELSCSTPVSAKARFLFRNTQSTSKLPVAADASLFVVHAFVSARNAAHTDTDDMSSVVALLCSHFLHGAGTYPPAEKTRSNAHF